MPPPTILRPSSSLLTDCTLVDIKTGEVSYSIFNELFLTSERIYTEGIGTKATCVRRRRTVVHCQKGIQLAVIEWGRDNVPDLVCLGAENLGLDTLLDCGEVTIQGSIEGYVIVLIRLQDEKRSPSLIVHLAS